MCECPGDQCHCEVSSLYRPIYDLATLTLNLCNCPPFPQVLTAYARECENAGVIDIIDNWRRETGCLNVTSFSFGSRNGGNDIREHYNEVAVADAPWAKEQVEEKSKWSGQVISAAKLNDQQKVEPSGSSGDEGLGRVEAGESLRDANTEYKIVPRLLESRLLALSGARVNATQGPPCNPNL